MTVASQRSVGRLSHRAMLCRAMHGQKNVGEPKLTMTERQSCRFWRRLMEPVSLLGLEAQLSCSAFSEGGGIAWPLASSRDTSTALPVQRGSFGQPWKVVGLPYTISTSAPNSGLYHILSISPRSAPTLLRHASLDFHGFIKASFIYYDTSYRAFAVSANSLRAPPDCQPHLFCSTHVCTRRLIPRTSRVFRPASVAPDLCSRRLVSSS